MEAKQLAAPLLEELGLSPEKEQKKTKKPKNKGKKAENKGNKPKKMKPLSQQSLEDSQNVNMQLERGEAMQNRKKKWEPPFSKSDPPPGKSASQKVNEKAEGKESPELALMKEMSQRMNQMERRMDRQKEAMDRQKEETDGLRKDIEDLKKRLELTERAASPNMLRDMVADLLDDPKTVDDEKAHFDATCTFY